MNQGYQDGDFYLSVQAIDQAGNINQGLQGTIHLVNSVNCGDEPPACLPAENQAAIFAEDEYQGKLSASRHWGLPRIGSRRGAADGSDCLH